MSHLWFTGYWISSKFRKWQKLVSWFHLMILSWKLDFEYGLNITNNVVSFFFLEWGQESDRMEIVRMNGRGQQQHYFENVFWWIHFIATLLNVKNFMPKTFIAFSEYDSNFKQNEFLLMLYKITSVALTKNMVSCIHIP